MRRKQKIVLKIKDDSLARAIGWPDGHTVDVVSMAGPRGKVTSIESATVIVCVAPDGRLPIIDVRAWVASGRFSREH